MSLKYEVYRYTHIAYHTRRYIKSLRDLNCNVPKDLTVRLRIYSNSTTISDNDKVKLLLEQLSLDNEITESIKLVTIRYCTTKMKRSIIHSNISIVHNELRTGGHKFIITGSVEHMTVNIKLSINKYMYNKLRDQHIGTNEFDDDLVMFLLRNDSLMSSTFPNSASSMHCAIPDDLYKILYDTYHFSMELFASPINARSKVFCSGNPEIDRYFGSIGKLNCSNLDIIDYEGKSHVLEEGVYECNPPYVLELCDDVADSIIKKCKSGKYTFICCFPLWLKPIAHFHEVLDNTKYLKQKVILEPDKHIFKPGDNWVEGKDQSDINPTFGNTIYIISSDNKCPTFNYTQHL